MSTEQNKTLLRNWIEEVGNQHNMAAFEQYLAPNVVDHSAPPGAPTGIAGVKQFFAMFVAAFPDLHETVDDIVAEGDKVVTRNTLRGTHTGAFLGIPPTGKPISVQTIDITRVVGGKLVEHWGQLDMLGLMQQLGAAPTPAAAGR